MHPFLNPLGHHKEHGAIQVHRKLASSGNDGAVAGEDYETKVLDTAGFAGAEARAFFQRLDEQLIKVNRFYQRKEGEFLERGECLRRKLQILVELKAAITEARRRRVSAAVGSADPEDPFVSCSILHGDESIRGITEQEHESQEKLTNDELSISEGLGDSGRIEKPREEAANKLRTFSGRTAPCQGRSMRINIPVTTPSRTVFAIRELLFDDMLSQSRKIGGNGSDGGDKLSINKNKVHQAEKMIRGALVELYKGLGYLKTYRSLNMLTFVKILKKFDKVKAKEVQIIYLKVVESSYFNSSDKFDVG